MSVFDLHLRLGPGPGIGHALTLTDLLQGSEPAHILTCSFAVLVAESLDDIIDFTLDGFVG